METENKIKKALDEIRPNLQADGGDLKFIKYSDGIVEIELIGACAGCPMSQITLKQGVEAYLMDKVPAVKEVRSV